MSELPRGAEVFHVMAKPAGPRCNLDCAYCFYKDKPHSAGARAMDFAALEAFVSKYIAENSAPEISFGWQGGEPLIAGLDFFKEAVRLQKKYARGKKIANCLQTNATLLDDAFCAFFREENFLLGISLDGPAHLHDPNRSVSHKDVLNGIKLCQKWGVDFNALCTVNSLNVKSPREIYKYFRGLGLSHVQFIPIVELDSVRGASCERFEEVSIPHKGDGARRAELSKHSPSAEEFGDFLISIFKLWCPKDIAKFSVMNFDDLILKALRGADAFCAHAKSCGRALALEQDGRAYSCDHFVQGNFLLGNIAENSFEGMLSGERQSAFAQSKSGRLSLRCKKCAFLKYCNGDCPKRRLDYYDAGDYPTSALCAGLKKFFAHAVPKAEEISRLAKSGMRPDEISEHLK